MKKIILPETIKYIIDLFYKNNCECFTVGGAVRDLIRGVAPCDYDLTSSAKPHEIIELCKKYNIKYIETGIKHGTVTLIKDNMNIEVTSYRSEGGYSDSRHPDEVEFVGDLKEDAARRDFTINAVYYNDKCGLVDYFGGISDIDNKIIRTVGNARERFGEDALRILRAIRFGSVLNFAIEEDMLNAVKSLKDNLKNISAERIRNELCKIFCCDDIYTAMNLLKDTVLDVVIPEFVSAYDMPQNHPHHLYNVFEHTIRAAGFINYEDVRRNGFEDNDFLILRLAALLHDIGKPDAHTFDENNTDHFKGHEAFSEKFAVNILSRLKFDKKTIRDVSVLIRYHDYRKLKTAYEVKKLLNIIGPRLFRMLLILKEADCKAQNMTEIKLKELNDIRDMFDKILGNDECFDIKNLAFNGTDVQKFSFEGKEISGVLNELLDYVMKNPDKNNHFALCEYMKGKKK